VDEWVLVAELSLAPPTLEGGGVHVSKRGRPTNLEVEDRRRRVLGVMADVALGHDPLVKKLAEAMGVEECTARDDLTAIVSECQAGRRVAAEVATALARVERWEDLMPILKRICVEMATGRLSHVEGRSFVLACQRARRKLARAARWPRSAGGGGGVASASSDGACSAVPPHDTAAPGSA
jgi:hypothetical protein